MKDILRGELVRLSAVDTAELSKAYHTWGRDSELMRLQDSQSVKLLSVKAINAKLEDDMKENTMRAHPFSIRALQDDRLLGDIGLYVNNWNTRDSFVGIGIGGRSDWSKGYGTDAMKIILRYAFAELNLRRVTLTVFQYNPRAIRSYEKAGFQHEGRLRSVLLRDGQRADLLYMGCLYEEWKQRNP